MRTKLTLNFQGMDVLEGVDFQGTFFVDTFSDDDFIGMLFGYVFYRLRIFNTVGYRYQSNRKTYAVTWKKGEQEYWENKPFVANARPGIQIKLIDSATGPGIKLRNAMWHSDPVPGEVQKALFS